MPRTEPEVLSRIEQERLTDYILSNLTPANLGIYLSLKTGIRIGELCGLRWGDISLEEREIGGLGIHLVRQIMDDVQYQYKDGQNILTLTKKFNS